MEYINKNRLRHLILIPEDFKTSADINILNQQLAASIVAIQDEYKIRRTPPSGIGDGDTLALQHLKRIEEVHDEITSLISLLPDYIKQVLWEKDLDRIWPEEDSVNLSKNPLQARYQDLLKILGNCASDFSNLKDILENTKKISLASERLYILDEPEDGESGLLRFENLHAQLCQRVQDDFRNHPAIAWAQSKLVEIRRRRMVVSESLGRLECAEELDQAYGEKSNIILPSTHRLYKYYMDYKEFSSSHKDTGWVEWAVFELDKLSKSLDPERRTYWHYKVRFGNHLSGEKPVRTYLEDEKNLIDQVNKAKEFCEKHVPPSLSNEYQGALLKADYDEAFVLYCGWLGIIQFPGDHLEDQVEQCKKFLDQFNSWEHVYSCCKAGSPNLPLEGGRNSGTLFGWVCEIVSCLERIPSPESGLPGASRWRRESYNKLDQYREKVIQQIHFASAVLDELVQKKYRWDLASQEVDAQARAWRKACQTHWIIQWLKGIKPEKEFAVLHLKICEGCQIAPRYDTYRKMYNLGCDPEKKLCQNMP